MRHPKSPAGRPISLIFNDAFLGNPQSDEVRTAVYTSHHYIIDVALGILCAIVGYLFFEYLLMRIPAISRLLDRYTAYVTLRP